MPSTTSATISMVANTGRLIETSERNILTCLTPGWTVVAIDDANPHAATERSDIPDDHALPLLEPGQNLRDPSALVHDPHLYLLLRHRLTVDRVHVRRAAFVLADAGDRNHQRFWNGASHNATRHER